MSKDRKTSPAARIARALLLSGVCLLGFSVARAEDAAPLFAATLTDLNGRPLSLSGYRGGKKPLLVNFWARWCPPCRQELPELEALHRAATGENGLVVLGIAFDHDPVKVRDFLRAYEVSFLNVLADEQGYALMQSLGNPHAALPFTVLIAPDGEILLKKIGRLSEQDVAAVKEGVEASGSKK